MTPEVALDQALTELRQGLEVFRALLAKPGSVAQGILFAPLDGSIVETPEAWQSLDKAISTWDITSESENGSVVRFPGVYEVSGEVIAYAAELNTRKRSFEDCVKELEASGLKPHQLRTLYAKAGHGRIHPLQAWRQINTLPPEGLESIGFTVAKSLEGIEVLTYPDALDRLRRVDAIDVIAQLETIPHPESVHWHEPVSRHIRANVVWNVESTRQARQYHASLPFLVPMGGWPSKRVRFNEPRQHAKRRDTKGEVLIHLPHRKGAYLSVA